MYREIFIFECVIDFDFIRLCKQNSYIDKNWLPLRCRTLYIFMAYNILGIQFMREYAQNLWVKKKRVCVSLKLEIKRALKQIRGVLRLELRLEQINSQAYTKWLKCCQSNKKAKNKSLIPAASLSPEKTEFWSLHLTFSRLPRLHRPFYCFQSQRVSTIIIGAWQLKCQLEKHPWTSFSGERFKGYSLDLDKIIGKRFEGYPLDLNKLIPISVLIIRGQGSTLNGDMYAKVFKFQHLISPTEINLHPTKGYCWAWYKFSVLSLPTTFIIFWNYLITKYFNQQKKNL